MKSVLTGLADIIFPSRCIICGIVLYNNEKNRICSECLSLISFAKTPICSCCGLPFFNYEGTDHLCGECTSSKQYFSVVRSVGEFKQPFMNAIHRFKYKGEISVGKTLGRLMAEFKYKSFSLEGYSLILPVPLHKRRLKERGFNQSVILAREVAKKHSVHLDLKTLKRTIHTKPQTGLGKKQRSTNVKGSFIVTDRKKTNGEKVVLIDDVYTTGSTVRECARVLLKNGVEKVAVLTLARAV